MSKEHVRMPGRRIGGLMRNDLRTVTLFMLFLIVLIAVMEGYQGPVPEPLPDTEPTDEDVPDLNMTTIDVVSISGHSPEGGTTDETFTLDQALVTKIEIELTWSDDIGDNDELRVTVLHEGEEVGSESSTNGRITITLVDEQDGGLGGNYTVEVTAVDCPGLVGPSPVNRDNGNTWDLVVRATVSQDGGD